MGKFKKKYLSPTIDIVHFGWNADLITESCTTNCSNCPFDGPHCPSICKMLYADLTNDEFIY
ncbi:MAG: hypothetical protein Q4E88_00720 [Coriobacteriia bacterium]|nr:hypothetical protein [Coriobacteriia bacterium]